MAASRSDRHSRPLTSSLFPVVIYALEHHDWVLVPAEQHINFRGVAECKPIPYEDIALNRDVVFLRHFVHHTEENVSGGAPKVETRYYTGFLTQRDGLHFYFVQFPLVGDGPPSIPGTILQDPGGRAANPETYDSRTMFWKMGELYIEGA